MNNEEFTLEVPVQPLLFSIIVTYQSKQKQAG